MKRLCIVMSLLILIPTSVGCGGMGRFGLRGARCGANSYAAAVPTCGTATLGPPVVRTTPSVTMSTPGPCANGQCDGPAIISAAPSSGLLEQTYGYEGPAIQSEILPGSDPSFDSASAGYGSNAVFSRVISDRKLTNDDEGKLPEPKLDE